MEKAKLYVKIWGKRGGSPAYSEKAMITAFISPKEGIQDAFISVDSFLGQGETYARRNECFITIKDGYGRIWEGTFAELSEILFDKK